MVSLIITALGVVVGFPLLTAACAAAHHHPPIPLFSSALLPLAAAVFGVLRGGERPCPMFWLFSGSAVRLSCGFAVSRGGGDDRSGDLH